MQYVLSCVVDGNYWPVAPYAENWIWHSIWRICVLRILQWNLIFTDFYQWGVRERAVKWKCLHWNSGTIHPLIIALKYSLSWFSQKQFLLIHLYFWADKRNGRRASRERMRESGTKVLRSLFAGHTSRHFVLFFVWYDEECYDKVAKFTLRAFAESPLFFRDKEQRRFLPRRVPRTVVNAHGASFARFRINNTALLFIVRD